MQPRRVGRTGGRRREECRDRDDGGRYRITHHAHHGQQYVFLQWAEGMQPYFGIALAGLGAVVAVVGLVLRPPKRRLGR